MDMDVDNLRAWHVKWTKVTQRKNNANDKNNNIVVEEWENKKRGIKRMSKKWSISTEKNNNNILRNSWFSIRSGLCGFEGVRLHSERTQHNYIITIMCTFFIFFIILACLQFLCLCDGTLDGSHQHSVTYQPSAMSVPCECVCEKIPNNDAALQWKCNISISLHTHIYCYVCTHIYACATTDEWAWATSKYVKCNANNNNNHDGNGDNVWTWTQTHESTHLYMCVFECECERASKQKRERERHCTSIRLLY